MVESFPKELPSLLYLTFNQDSSCFAIGTESGFSIYNSVPYKDSFERNMNGGIGIIEMLNRCNILALVGGGKNPKYAKNKVAIWDDHQGKVISELRFNSEVRNVKLTRDKIFVVCDQKIFIFAFISFENIDTIETSDNIKGLISVSTDSSTCIVAFPDKTVGGICVKNYDNNGTLVTINAHQSALACFTLNANGTLLATTSEKGTLIRIFNTTDGTFIKELRRGSENAEIYSLAFDPVGKYLACTSDRKTVHVFLLGLLQKGNKIEVDQSEKEEVKKTTSVFGKISGFFGVENNYLNSERSFAQFKINDNKAICSFGPDNSIVVISSEGKYYQFEFNAKNGETMLLQDKDILKGSGCGKGSGKEGDVVG
jgi:WD40 repeat protein